MANTVIQLKYSNTTGTPPSLNLAEPAYSSTSNKLWINDGSGVVAIGGKFYADLLDSATSSSTANTIVRRDTSGNFSTNIISANSFVSSGYDLYTFANNAFNTANNALVAGGQIAGSYANSAYIHANAAFSAANTKFSSNGGSISGYANVSSNVSVGTHLDIIDIDTVKPAHKEGRLFYDGEQKALSYYNDNSNMTLQINQEMVIRVWNSNGSPIPDGKAVYINGLSSANGFPSVALANSATQATSEVVGVTTTTIPAGGYGYITQAGKVNGLNTASLTEGQELYLSATNPGELTTTIPPSPAIPVSVAYVSRSDLTNGSILINIHLMEGENKTTGAVLFAYNNAIYEDPSNFFYDRANNRLGIGTNTPTANLHVAGDGLFTGNVVISGNLLVSNAQSITTTELTVGGNVVILNANVTGSPIANAEIIVNRGTSLDAYIRWDEVYDEWVIDEGDGVTGHILASSKTAKTWADYTGMDAYEKESYPIGANLANTINEHAKSSYAYANTTGAHAIAGFNQANTAFNNAAAASSYANSAYTKANTAAIDVAAASSYANSAFARANTANTTATSASSYANSAYAQANTAANNATSAGSYANSAFLKANTATSDAATAYTHAVSGYNQANSATISASSAGSYANSAFLKANTAANNATSAGSYANSAFGVANTADQRAVTSGSYANSAFAVANTKLSASGGTISGSLSITGDLTVSGNTVYVDTEIINVQDSLIKLANNNTSDVLDIGFYGQYNNGSNKYSGLVRDASDGIFKLFTNETVDPTSNVVAYGSDNRATIEANFTGGNVSGLFNAISVSDGGSGAKTFTVNHVLLGNGSSPFASVGSSTEGHILTIDSTGAPKFQHLNGGSF